MSLWNDFSLLFYCFLTTDANNRYTITHTFRTTAHLYVITEPNSRSWCFYLKNSFSNSGSQLYYVSETFKNCFSRCILSDMLWITCSLLAYNKKYRILSISANLMVASPTERVNFQRNHKNHNWDEN